MLTCSEALPIAEALAGPLDDGWTLRLTLESPTRFVFSPEHPTLEGVADVLVTVVNRETGDARTVNFIELLPLPDDLLEV